jgi:hypothetical protein
VRQRQLAATRQRHDYYNDQRLHHRVAGARVDLRERWMAADDELQQLYDRQAGNILDLRQRELAAARLLTALEGLGMP